MGISFTAVNEMTAAQKQLMAPYGKGKGIDISDSPIYYFSNLDSRHLPDPVYTDMEPVTDPYIIEKLKEFREDQIARGMLVEIDGEYVGRDYDPDVELSNQERREIGEKSKRDGINWTGIETGLKKHVFSSTEINPMIEYAAAQYKNYEEYIQSNFTGEELDKHMSTLSETASLVMEKAVNRYVKKYIGSFLEQNGVNGEKDVLSKSISAVYNERISSETDKPSTDSGVSDPDDTPETLYSMDEILALSFLQEAAGRGHGTC